MDESKNQLPDILCVIQVCIFGIKNPTFLSAYGLSYWLPWLVVYSLFIKPKGLFGLRKHLFLLSIITKISHSVYVVFLLWLSLFLNCYLQVCLEGQISRQSAKQSLSNGHQPFGDQIPWKFCEQFRDTVFPSLSGARIVRIATHPSAMRVTSVFWPMVLSNQILPKL